MTPGAVALFHPFESSATAWNSAILNTPFHSERRPASVSFAAFAGA
jgi:hypothetical protein